MCACGEVGSVLGSHLAVGSVPTSKGVPASLARTGKAVFFWGIESFECFDFRIENGLRKMFLSEYLFLGIF